jgi:hypothetical protein
MTALPSGRRRSSVRGCGPRRGRGSPPLRRSRRLRGGCGAVASSPATPRAAPRHIRRGAVGCVPPALRQLVSEPRVAHSTLDSALAANESWGNRRPGRPLFGVLCRDCPGVRLRHQAAVHPRSGRGAKATRRPGTRPQASPRRTGIWRKIITPPQPIPRPVKSSEAAIRSP